MTFLNGKRYEDWMDDWKNNNVHHETGTCPECGGTDSNKFYSGSIEMDGKRHWYSGHKYCVSAYMNKVKKEYDMKQKNKDHVKLLKDSADDFLDEKVNELTFKVQKNRGDKKPRYISFDMGHGG